MGTKTHKGSCHCGKVRYEVDLDLGAGTGRCNCSICGKSRFWGAMVKPHAFRLLAGKEDLSDYQFGSKSGHHVFCKHCGVRSFGHGNVEAIGGEYYSVNVACLDDLDQSEMAALQIQFMDGRNNSWWTPPAHTAHL